MTFAKTLSESDLNATPDSIPDILCARADELGDRCWLDFIDDGERLSYREAATRARHVACGLLELGVAPGDKVGLLLGGSKSFVLGWFATLSAAMVDVPINPDSRGDVLDHAIRQIEITALFADLDGLAALATAGERMRAQLALVVATDAAFEAATRDGLAPRGVGRFVSLGQLEAAGRESVKPFPAIDTRALASIRFSSGTTGMPKGVMMDHGHMLASARKFNEMMNFGGQDRMYTCFPFHHVFATVTGVLATLCSGGSMVVARKFSASRYWKDIRDNHVTRAHLLDPLVPLLMKQPPDPRDRQHAVPVMYTAAGHYPEFEARFGVRIIALYDMSELTVVAHYPPGLARRPGSCGTLSGLFDVRIVDDGGNEVADGADGDILVRPRHAGLMFMGYYNEAEQTVARWRDLWFQTGDRGRKGTDGYFYFLGRSGDRIRRRGVNISAEQIESAALALPQVLECAAIAVPSPLGEDDIKLCARLAPGVVAAPREIAAALLASLPRALTVRYYEIFGELPKTQTEKVKRAALRLLGERGLTPETWDHETGAYWTPAETDKAT